MTTISAQGILQSLNEQTGDTLFTVLLRYPRTIHEELLTHRAFSRNAASSRAIPTQKLIAEASANPAIPLFWYENEPGMQGRIELSDETREEAIIEWHKARLSAIKQATKIAALKAHKQIVNRLLEPYTHITTLVTSSEWDNFSALRNHPDAEPHFQLLAQAIKEASHITPTQVLKPGQWHLPFITPDMVFQSQTEMLRFSVACCASTSYKTVEGFEMTREKAEKICSKLLTTPLHASPLEHVALADQLYNGDYLHPTSHRNFKGFEQLRALIEQEEITL